MTASARSDYSMRMEWELRFQCLPAPATMSVTSHKLHPRALNPIFKMTAERTLSGTHMRLWEFRSFVQLYWGSNVVDIAVVVKQTCT